MSRLQARNRFCQRFLVERSKWFLSPLGWRRILPQRYMTNYGVHWEQVPVPHGWSLAQGHFISEDFGIVVANDNGPPGSAVLELTKNGGSNWETVQTKFHPFAIDPVSPTSWWAIGGTDVTFTRNTAKLGSRQMLWNLDFTGDGGKSWDEFIANWHVVGGLDFVSTSEGYVWVPGILYRTVDRGRSFIRGYLPPQIGLEGISSMTFQPRRGGLVAWERGLSHIPYHRRRCSLGTESIAE